MAEQFYYFYDMLKKSDDKNYIESFLSYNTSLICAGVKPSITLNLSYINNKDMYKLWKLYGEQYIKEMKLKFAILRKNKDSVILLIYDEKLLKQCIERKSCREFLQPLGYSKDFTIDEYIMKLISRYNKYKCPHELGIFLGYPLEDVIDFMNCTNKKCKACGYWKVYNREERAKNIFSIYDNVRLIAANKIVNGYRKNDLLLSLRREFYKESKIIFEN